MSVEMSPTMAEVYERFLVEREQGRPSVAKMVLDFAIENSAANLLADSADKILGESIRAGIDPSSEEVQRQLNFAQGLIKEAKSTNRRYAFASYLLGELRTE